MDQFVSHRRTHVQGEPSQMSKMAGGDCGHNIAAQSFVEEETVTADSVVQLLSTAMHLKEEEDVLKNLQVVQELIIHKESKLLDHFFDKVVSFLQDPKSKVRKFVVEFIEEACRKNPQILPKIVENLNLLLDDKNANVQKKVIQTTIHLYPLTIKWLCSAGNVDEVMEATWISMSQLKNRIIPLLDSKNAGVSLLAAKFMELVIITQTFKDQYTESKSGNISLDDIPFIFKIFSPRNLEEEAKKIFFNITHFLCAIHITSVNLMACIQILATIAKNRFEFFPKVLETFESLHANLPPTLSISQLSSVRKILKLHLCTLKKHPGAVEFHVRISCMLFNL